MEKHIFRYVLYGCLLNIVLRFKQQMRYNDLSLSCSPGAFSGGKTISENISVNQKGETKHE